MTSNNERPGSSVPEQRLIKPKEVGSNPTRGSTWHYVIVRKEMTGGALLAQAVHAAGESVRTPLPPDTRAVVLVATKSELALLKLALINAFVDHTSITENEGPLEGVITAIGLVTTDRDSVRPLLSHLKVYR